MKRNYFDLFSKPNSQKGLSFGNQSLIGTDDDDIITGGADNDVIEGFGGADKLDGGAETTPILCVFSQRCYCFSYQQLCLWRPWKVMR